MNWDDITGGKDANIEVPSDQFLEYKRMMEGGRR